ncbi:MAG: energy transducer TonB [Verrucomicrobiota bacterium]
MTTRSATSWRAPQWLAAVAAIFLVQFLLIYFLSPRNRISTHTFSTPFLLQISHATLTEAEFSKRYLENDPASFTLPGARGFSGVAWLKAPAHGYGAENLFEQKESPFWLTLNVSQLGNGINQFVRSNTIAPILQAEDSSPRFQTRVITVADETKTSSRLRVEGELASRPLLSTQELSSVQHTNLLNKTVAQIAVDQNGLVLSARLLSKSGSQKADRIALEAARQFQFAPDKRPIVWGNLIFDWHTIPVGSTNATVQPK